MSQVQKSPDDLKNDLKNQIQFLKRSTEAFDKGFEEEAIRLATTMRVLLHNTQNSTSLLKLLDKENIKFYNTAHPFNPNNLLSQSSLVTMRIGGGGGKYVAMLDDRPPSVDINKRVPFDEWWKNIILSDTKGYRLTRKELITTITNKEGGAHVDPMLDESYHALTRDNTMGWVYSAGGETKEFDNNVTYPSIRQIAHEVLKTLNAEFLEYF